VKVEVYSAVEGKKKKERKKKKKKKKKKQKKKKKKKKKKRSPLRRGKQAREILFNVVCY